MQVVINIDDEFYKRVMVYKGEQFPDNDDLLGALITAVNNGTPIPKGHGAIKDVSKIEIPMCEDRTYERWVQVAINSAPTIINADRSEE